jgi:hypothetical protein
MRVLKWYFAKMYFGGGIQKVKELCWKLTEMNVGVLAENVVSIAK